MNLSRTLCEINSDFSRKSLKKIPTPVYLNALAEGVPLELGIGTWGQETRMMGLLGHYSSLTMSSAVWIQYTNVTDRRTDGHRATAKTVLTCSVVW